MDHPHPASMSGLDMLGSPHSDGVSNAMSSSLSMTADPHATSQLAAVAHHSMYGHTTPSMMSSHSSLSHSHHPHHSHPNNISIQDTETDPRFDRLTQTQNYCSNFELKSIFDFLGSWKHLQKDLNNEE